MDGQPGPKAAGVAKREDSYGPKSGPNAGSRASSPGEQAAACDYKKLVSWAPRATGQKLVSWAIRVITNYLSSWWRSMRASRMGCQMSPRVARRVGTFWMSKWVG